MRHLCYRKITNISSANLKENFLFNKFYLNIYKSPIMYHTCTIQVTAPIPFSVSRSTTSEISNNLRGNGIFLLDAIVFKMPGSRLVRAI